LEGKKPWSDPIIMEALSERYGWTPKQIRDMPITDIFQYLEIIKAIKSIEKIRELKSRKH